MHKKKQGKFIESFYNLYSNKSILIPSNNSCVQKKEENRIGSHINNSQNSNINKRSTNTKKKENLELTKISSKFLVKFFIKF